MLKIKDNVDLKELEKFGFKKYDIEQSTWRSLHSKDKYKFIGEKYREVGYKLDDGCNEITIAESRVNCDWNISYEPREIYVCESDYEMGVSMQAYDVIFDLIKADIVEKV